MKNIYKIAHKIVLNEEKKPHIKIKANAVPTRDVAPSSETSGKPRIKLTPAVNNVPAEAPVAKEKLPNVIRSNRPSAPSTAQAPASNKVPSRYPAPNVPDEIRGTVRRPAPVPQNLGQPTAPATPKPSPVNPVATAAKPGFLDKAKGAIKGLFSRGNVGAALATYSPALNSGEDQAVAKIKQADRERLQRNAPSLHRGMENSAPVPATTAPKQVKRVLDKDTRTGDYQVQGAGTPAERKLVRAPNPPDIAADTPKGASSPNISVAPVSVSAKPSGPVVADKAPEASPPIKAPSDTPSIDRTNSKPTMNVPQPQPAVVAKPVVPASNTTNKDDDEPTLKAPNSPKADGSTDVTSGNGTKIKTRDFSKPQKFFGREEKEMKFNRKYGVSDGLYESVKAVLKKSEEKLQEAKIPDEAEDDFAYPIKKPVATKLSQNDAKKIQNSHIDRNTINSNSVIKKPVAKKVTEDTELEEGLRLVAAHSGENNGHTTKVYRDAEWEEYRVKHFIDGKHLDKSDYHTDDKEEAHSHAKNWAMNGGDKKKIKESSEPIQELTKDTLFRYMNKATKSSRAMSAAGNAAGADKRDTGIATALDKVSRI